MYKKANRDGDATSKELFLQKLLQELLQAQKHAKLKAPCRRFRCPAFKILDAQHITF